MAKIRKISIIYLLVISIVASVASAAVGDVIHVLGDNETLPFPGVDTFCSVGLAFDGSALYYDRCGDTNIYKINPLTATLISSFDTVNLTPNAMAFDSTRNGIWFGVQSCDAIGMPIYFWDHDDNSTTLKFHVPFALINPATNSSFLGICFLDGLAFNANGVGDLDDELWFSDDINPNVGVFRPDGTFVTGYDATVIDPSLITTSGLAIGGTNLYLANNGGGDVFRAAIPAFTFLDNFSSGDDRQEDMECDPETFAPTEVMWVRTTPQGGANPDVMTAYEIESNTCGLGGGEPEPEPLLGRMTGGGSVLGSRVTHGFELHCNVTQTPNRLQVNWAGNRFHLEPLTRA